MLQSIIIILIVGYLALLTWYVYKKLSLKPLSVKWYLHDGAIMPTKVDLSDGGYDVYANMKVFDELYKSVDFRKDFTSNISYINGVLTIKAGGRCLIPTGLYASFSKEYKMNMRPRSGMAAKSGITLTNAPGLIDSKYRGDIGVILQNTSSVSYVIDVKKAIAQIEFVRNEYPVFEVVSNLNELDSTDRGGGFGHSDEAVKETIPTEVGNRPATEAEIHAKNTEPTIVAWSIVTYRKANWFEKLYVKYVLKGNVY